MGRRAFLAGAGSAVAFAALSGSAGISLSPARASEAARALGISGEARGLAAGADRLVAVGRDADGNPAIWTADAADGADGKFDAVNLGGAFEDAELHGVHLANGTYLAMGAVTVRETVRFEPGSTSVGGEETYEFTRARRVPAIWRSDDVDGWERQLLEDAAGGSGVLVSAANDGSRVVAVGSRLDADSAEGLGALVLASDDARSWQAAAINAADQSLPEGGLTDVIAHDGRWIAVGGHIEGGVVMASGDGRSWSVWDAADAKIGGDPLQGIAATDGVLVAAAAAIDDPRPALLASDDGGRSWGADRARLRTLSGRHASVNALEVSERDQSLLALGAKSGKPTIERGGL